MVWFAWSGNLGPGAVVCFPLDTPIHVFFCFSVLQKSTPKILRCQKLRIGMDAPRMLSLNIWTTDNDDFTGTVEREVDSQGP